MRRRLVFASLAVLLACVAGCNRNAPPKSEEPAIRAALQKYLASRTGLNLAAMDMTVKQISVTGNTAQARVEFKAKQSGEGMEMTYNLERQGNDWVVKTSQNTSGMAHPLADAGTSGSGGALPAGHPPVTDPSKTSTPPKKN
jgi:hypothetical protein